MRRSKVLSNIVVLSVFCIFMLTIVPLCTVDRIDVVTELSTDEIAPEVLPVERVAVQALDDMPGRMAAQMAYDSESDRIILFGGAIQNLYSDYDDTWSFDYNTNTWTNMSPATNPPATAWHQMTYHSSLDRVVLFGGHLEGGGSNWDNSNETWAYDYNTNTWTNMSPALAPPGLSGASMEYDSESDLIVLYGGWTDGGIYSSLDVETWTYDLTSNTWTNVTPSVQPHSRSWS
ncbi:MAG: Kelch repeat-containing protein, partial [Candidatus Thorarchaeota archaeon]